MTKSLPPKSLILYADDDADDRQLVTEAFHDYADTVDLLTFTDGEALLHYAKGLQPGRHTPCLVILDINMPRMNGKETLLQLRQLDPFADVPAVLFTTSTLPSEARFARQYDAGFITKPLDTAQMMQIVDQFIDHCGEETQKQIRRNRNL